MPEKSRRITEESSRAKEVCEIYLGMGTERSLSKLCKVLEKPSGYERVLKEWSRTFNWQERARIYDAEQREKKRRARELQVEQMNERHAQIGLTQQKNALEQIQKLISAGEWRDTATVQLLKFATDIERLARGTATEQLALTGKDEGPVEIVVETFWGRGTDPRRKSEESTEEAEIDTEVEDVDDFGIEVEDEEPFNENNS